MYIKRPGGKIWHVIADLRGGRSLCGSLSVRPAFVALFASDEITRGLSLCKNCEKASAQGRTFHDLQPASRAATTRSGSSSASGLSG
jgi:hypothetical protein